MRLTVLFAAFALTAHGARAQSSSPPQGAAPGAAAQKTEGRTYQGGLPAMYLTSQDVQNFLKALPKDAITDAPIRVVDVGGYRVGVFGVFRPKSQPGDAIAHETRTTEIYYVLDGGGTLVTGGTITDMKAPPQGRN